MNDVKILGIGTATMDMYVDRGRMYPGGNEYNVACNVVYLGGKAGFLGVFANDQAGKILEETLKKIGVDVSGCHHETGSSGYCLVKLTEEGERIFLYWNREGVTDLYPIGFTEEEIAYAKGFDVVCFGRCAYISQDKIHCLYDNGIDICYDFHAAYDDEEVKRIAPYVKYAFFSTGHLDEEKTKHYLKLAVDCGCELAVGTKGADPVYACDGKRYYRQNTVPTEVKDALGAGDSYIAAVLFYYLGGKKQGIRSEQDNIRQALARAAFYASKVIQTEGGVGVGMDFATEKIEEILGAQVDLEKLMHPDFIVEQ